jgi:hypothetical protein
MKRPVIFSCLALLAISAVGLFYLQHSKSTVLGLSQTSAAPTIDDKAKEAGASDNWMANATRFIEEDSMKAKLDKGQASLLQPRQDLRASLGADGLVVKSAGIRAMQAMKEGQAAQPDNRIQPSPTPNAQEWSFSFKTQRYGRSTAMQEIAYGEPQVLGKRMSMKAAGITEWYENKAEGIEQGFTIKARPAGQGEVQIESAVVAGCSMQQDGQGVVLKQDGKEVLRYGQLKVLDAKGRELKSRLELMPCALLKKTA